MLKSSEKIWMDGKFVNWKDANVHVLTHTLHYGVGAFEGIRCYKTADGPAIFRLDEHVERLFTSSHILQINIPYTREDIREAILIILGTAKGERLMRPEFGCVIHEYVFCSMDVVNLHLIENAVREALIMWEPRIKVISVKAEPDSEEGKLLMEIDYQVRTTNTRFNLVYPFYLKEG